MNLLYVDINARYLNPTRRLISVALGEAGRLTCFGPGFVTSDVLSAGLEAFVDQSGPYDVVITNSHVIFADAFGPAPGPELFRRSYAFEFPGNDVLHLPKIAACLQRLKIPRVAILLESDYYNWTVKEIDLLDSRIDFTMGFGKQFFRKRKELANLHRETFAARATDDWIDFADSNESRIANFVHFVGDQEFSFGSIAQRSHLWTILGIGYDARATAAKALLDKGISPRGETLMRRGLGLAQRLGVGQRDLFIDALNRDFRNRLASARYSYTCGSGLDMPIRKFFEIPAAGAVLACRPFNGFNDAGFLHGQNCVVSEPADIVDAHKWLESDPDRAQRIADAGRNLIIQQHSVAARARQFAETLSAVVDGSFAGGRWSNGEYSILRKADQAGSTSSGLTTR